MGRYILNGPFFNNIILQMMAAAEVALSTPKLKLKATRAISCPRSLHCHVSKEDKSCSKKQQSHKDLNSESTEEAAKKELYCMTQQTFISIFLDKHPPFLSFSPRSAVLL